MEATSALDFGDLVFLFMFVCLVLFILEDYKEGKDKKPPTPY
jgi:hypothetical protein